MKNLHEILVIRVAEAVILSRQILEHPLVERVLHALAAHAIAPVPSLGIHIVPESDAPFQEAQHDERHQADEEMRLDVFARPHEDGARLQRPLHHAELVLDAAQAVVRLDDFLRAHGELRCHDLVVAHAAREFLDLLVVKERQELARIRDFPRLLVDDIFLEEAREHGGVAARHAEGRWRFFQLLQEREELLVLVALAFVELAAPVHDDLLLELAHLSALVFPPACHDARLVAEILARTDVSLVRKNPLPFLCRRLADALADEVTLPVVDERTCVLEGAHTAVCHEHVAFEVEPCEALLQRGAQRRLVERVSGERLHRDGDAIVVEEQAHLHDGLLAVLLRDAALAEPLHRLAVHFLILVRTLDLEVEIRHVVEELRRAAADAFLDGGVHALDELPLMCGEDVQEVVYAEVVGRRIRRGHEIIRRLLYGRDLRCGGEDAAEEQEP